MEIRVNGIVPFGFNCGKVQTGFIERVREAVREKLASEGLEPAKPCKHQISSKLVTSVGQLDDADLFVVLLTNDEENREKLINDIRTLHGLKKRVMAVQIPKEVEFASLED